MSDDDCNHQYVEKGVPWYVIGINILGIKVCCQMIATECFLCSAQNIKFLHQVNI